MAILRLRNVIREDECEAGCILKELTVCGGTVGETGGGDGGRHFSPLKFFGDIAKRDLLCLGKGKKNYRGNSCIGPWRMPGSVLGQQIQEHIK